MAFKKLFGSFDKHKIVIFGIRGKLNIKPGIDVFRKLQSDAVKPDYGSLN